MDNRVRKVDAILSFLPAPNKSDYDLIQVDKNIRACLINLIDQLEQIPQVYLCVRGDSKKDINDHEKFFTEKLSGVFIVGEKARSNMRSSPGTTHRHYEVDPSCLIAEIVELVNQVNNEISEKAERHNITGTISPDFVKSIENQDSDLLEKWKMFFLSFLHNNGKCKQLKMHSPFLSLTYGYEKYITARKFALDRCAHSKGIVYLYCLNSDWPYYKRTIDFTKELNNFGVKWYRDIHKEIMLINGMYPHYLLGIFEVEPFRNPKFIINPWLYKMLLSNETFDYAKGIKVDQTYFSSFAHKMGYETYFFQLINDCNEYVSEISQSNSYKVYRP